ncbi:MAG TPA: signal peptide peptidase SppA [Bryobacteraceae bacterium]|nr:signal peptide peptidase SppA [Bryobacteraceae bacterium]
MKKFLLGILAGLILAGLTVVVLGFAAMRFSQREPSLPDRFVLNIRIEGSLTEVQTTSPPLPSMEDQVPLTVPELYALFDRAARDPRVKAVYLRPSGIAAGWAKVEEIRRGVEQVRKAGKPVYAWLRAPRLKEFYIASAAEKVYMSPEDLLDAKGLRLQATYFKGTLDKLGVAMEVEHAGKYKDAGDIFTRTSMSPETREAMNSILDDSYGRILAVLSTGRNKTPEQMRALLDEGPFLAPVAKRESLVDELNYEPAARKAVIDKAGVGESGVVRDRAYLAAGWSPKTEGKRRRVALLVAQGDIVRAGTASPFGEDTLLEPGEMTALAKQIGADRTIDAVVVRIDSPGGDAVASDEILSAMKELSKKKPLVISMSDLAASGGYYMAMTGDPIVAEAGTLTGSIGVIYGKPNIKGLYEKLGISSDSLTRGRFAGIDSAVEPLSPEGRAKLREGVDFIYSGFLRKVAEGRKKPIAEVEPNAQGRVWLGSQARERGLVDEVGGLARAIQLVSAKAKFGKQDAVSITTYPRKKSFFEQLLGMQESRLAKADPTAMWLVANAPAGTAAWLSGGMLRVIPFSVDLR